MPEIEELQTSTRTAAPGWSYVVDTGYDPSKVAINPSSRKRVRTTANEASASNTSDLTLRQQTAIQRHLAELDRDSHREVLIPIPRPISSKKQTVNARRILGSGKTFQHYLEEDEARRALHGDRDETWTPPAAAAAISTATDPSASVVAAPTQRASKTPYARRKPAVTTPQSTPLSRPTSTAPVRTVATPSGAQSTTTTTSTSASTSTPAQSAPKPIFQPGTILALPSALSISEEEIEALLAGPPLSYAASKSQPEDVRPGNPPARKFCEICGYWGRVRCVKCGARVCGIECRDVHDEGRCLKFYA